VLPKRAATALGLIPKNDGQGVAMVISHDCDCVAKIEQEEYVEVIIGSPVSKLDGNLTYAKSTRKLHLKLAECGRVIELTIATKRTVRKKDLTAFKPDDSWILSRDEKKILALWLAARYSRSAFPDVLNERLRAVKESFHKAAKKHGGSAIGIFMGFDPQRELDDATEPYTLDISVVYDAKDAHASKSCLQFCEDLASIFESAYCDANGRWTGIELQSCEAISDIEFTYHDALSTPLYRLDHMSLSQDPQGSLPG
jgi:hypothetical protein